LIRRFFIAVGLSWYGDWLSTVALVVVLYQLTGNPAGPAGYMLARVAPRVVGPWIGGNLADQLSPRRIMVSGAALQGVLTLSLVWSHRAGAMWGIYAAVATAQFVGALSRPSNVAMIPSLVPDGKLPRANATYGLLISTSIFVGPAIGAGLLLKVGPDALFAIDAGTFLFSALLAMTLPSGRQAEQAAGPGPRRGSAFGIDGIVDALRQREVRMVAVANFGSGVTVTVTQALLVVAARERFGGDAAVGYLYAAAGLGSTVGGLLALRWAPRRALTRLAVFLAASLEIVAIVGFSVLTAIFIALALLALSSASASSFEIWGSTEVQRRAPPGFMARFNGVAFLAMYAGMLIGALWALGTSALLPWDHAIQIACAATLLLVAITWTVDRVGAPTPGVKEEP
jgi:MFS family permease